MKRIYALISSLLIASILFSVCAFAANIPGDVYTDGKVNTKDATRLAQHLAWGISLSADEMKAADVRPDGVINSKDAVLLAQYLAGWGVSLGSGTTTNPDNGSNDNDVPFDDLV